MKIQVKDKSKPSRLFFKKCLVCGSLFTNHNKRVYCQRCRSAITPRTTAQELKELANKPLPEPKIQPQARSNPMIIDHNHPEYKAIRDYANGFQGQYNGCWYYSHEIVDNIIPNVKTKRGWNTVGRELTGMCDGMIVFLHDNATPFNYGWLRKYNDLVLVCSSDYTRQAVCYSGHAVLLPMSIDTEYVKQFRVKKKTKDTCFVGNWWVREQMTNPSALVADKVDFLSNIPREKLLKEVAKYKKAYAIDRCAMECKVLGCELLELDTRYHCENVGNVVDNRDAAKMLQQILNSIDGGEE